MRIRQSTDKSVRATSNLFCWPRSARAAGSFWKEDAVRVACNCSLCSRPVHSKYGAGSKPSPEIDRARLVEVRLRPDGVEVRPEIDRVYLVEVRARPEIDRVRLVEVRLRPDGVEARPDIDRVRLVEVEARPDFDRLRSYTDKSVCAASQLQRHQLQMLDLPLQKIAGDPTEAFLRIGDEKRVLCRTG